MQVRIGRNILTIPMAASKRFKQFQALCRVSPSHGHAEGITWWDTRELLGGGQHGRHLLTKHAEVFLTDAAHQAPCLCSIVGRPSKPEPWTPQAPSSVLWTRAAFIGRWTCREHPAPCALHPAPCLAPCNPARCTLRAEPHTPSPTTHQT